MKRFTLFLSVIFLGSIFLCASAEAIPVWGTEADLTGLRSTAVDEGLMVDPTSSTWADGNFEVSWEITFDSGLYTYIYSINRLSEQGAVSHMLLETTEDENPFNFTTPYNPDDIEGPKLWTGSGGKTLPNPLWGIKFDIEEEELLEEYGYDLVQYIITTDRAPVWGVAWWYGPGRVAYTAALDNENYKTNDGLTELDFIARPNSAPAPIPEPATMLLLGSGLIGLAAVGRRKFFKK